MSTNSEHNKPIPFTTEEPVRREWLRKEMLEINDASQDQDTSDISSDPDLSDDQNAIKNISEESTKYTGNDMMTLLSREMNEYQEKQEDEVAAYEKRVAEADTEEDLLSNDPELLQRTEKNRNIPYEPKSSSSNTLLNEAIRRELLVFSDNPTVIEEPTKLSVIQYYGAGKTGIMPMAYRTKRKSKAYLVACDFSKESLYALEWTMGTMMRDGDELDVATVLNRDDNPDIVTETGLDLKSELHVVSNALIVEAKKLLSQMMLFNITLRTHVVVGRVKDMLRALTRVHHHYTLLVCGSRGRSSVRNLLMGSVSTFLVHKSPVPVAVVRRQKRKRSKFDKGP
ncbi:uncharacterized protein B0P05DRAFT_232892 [Gilbertella persicaria]|uniref:uncharacterized protein n=1 Tax=Gilbertella persicaria TaxID=101096 RepID=UPI0022201D9E|nr:uncharacterized protein B0P05DRAFT_232892 [Gilbertella persicaria]KAI8064284.1 hypothetical protein B0P05DRAFT_232892 [Gilbertella persicaria]